MQKNNVQTAEYARLAGEYDRRWAFYIEQTTRATIAHINASAQERILDVGCGTGALLNRLAATHPSARLLGIDPVPEMLSVARRRLPPAAQLCLGWAESLPVADSCFDWVVSCNMFHYITAPQAALQEILRVLRPGGRLVITDWCDDYWACRLCGMYLRLTRRPLKIYGQHEFVRLLADNSYVVDEIASYKINWLWGIMTAVAVKKPD